MANVTVVGAQWGDEGKGKVVDWLSARADVVVRFQGGHNAGHTLVIGNQEFKLSLLPSGVVRDGKLSVIGNGVVVDPQALVDEIGRLAEKGVAVTPGNLAVAENACLILPSHGRIDRAREAVRGAGKIGTTGRGIGPAYEDKVGRRAIRLCDLRDETETRRKLEGVLEHHNFLLRGYNEPEANLEEALSRLMRLAKTLLPYAQPVWRLLGQKALEGKRILFEGAQAVMLDIDFGTYPFVTSSNTVAGQAATGTGLGPKQTGMVLGICKAYTTRVGAGPFPAEDKGADGDRLGQLGHEFGTVTGRKRRCGWFDATMVRQAVQVGGIDSLVLTKLDVLDQFDTVRIATSYRLDGRECELFPADMPGQAAVEPVFETLPGWKTSTRGLRSFEDLPKEAAAYVKRLEELVGAPFAMISTSPEREDMILRRDPFEAV